MKVQTACTRLGHTFDVEDFPEAYRVLLQRVVDEVWAWDQVKYDKRGRKGLIPILQTSLKKFVDEWSGLE
ncbi:MAG: hypothetical protein NZ895_03735 [Archaeoglobaceae archaeon]|nr:hypothetical protein [Archaeoglobaceae archaeon]MCX8152420.1 hypothetical protein [Archaeoglobaceae archaeon]MDW8013760.1 hypothetical protein [Archaeoglobaceae archaeon]